MMVLKWFPQFLSLLFLVTVCDACFTDDDCTDDSEICVQGSCECVDGFEMRLGTCSQVLGKSCSSWYDCSNVSNAECINSVCVCRQNPPSVSYYDVNGSCISVIGRPCTDSVECLGYSSVTCRDGECKCFDGYSQVGDSCSQTWCTSNDNCTDSNTICQINYCTCTEGYSLLNGSCTAVLGSACGWSSSYYCDYSLHTTCIGAVCVCYSGYYDNNGVCVSVLGKACQTDADCDLSTGLYCNATNTCDCTGSYIQNGDTCRTLYGSSCTSDSDCPMQYMNCSNRYYYSSYGYCYCVEGAYLDYRDYYCKPEIGSNCSSFTYHCNSVPHYCNANGICSCGFGTVSSADSLSCDQVYNKTCNVSGDCINTNMYKCEEGLCVCSDAYIEMGYHNFWLYDIPCTKAIGQSCNFTNCSIENAGCNAENICVCKAGYLEINGLCQKGLGTNCYHDLVCQSFDANTKCDIDNTCQCLEGYTESDILCTKVLGSSCMNNVDCDIVDAVCSNVDLCECPSGYSEAYNQCFAGGCAEPVTILPDLRRRFLSYGLDYPNEEILCDDNREEKWYSIGQNLPLTSSDIPSTGNCGTLFPIYIEPLSAEQLNHMTQGEIEVEATVGGLGQYGMTEMLNVKLRKCGEDYQLFLKRPTTKGAAYCLGGQNRELNNRPIVVPSVKSQLFFDEVMIDNVTRYEPFILFQCDFFNNYHYYYQNYQNYETYYIVNWYVNDEHLISYGPATVNTLNDTKLPESTLLDFGLSIGFQIQCSYQIMESLSGHISKPKFSAKVDTNIKTKFFVADGYDYISPNLNVPLGCSTEKEDPAKKCKYRFLPLTDGSVSNCNASTNAHDLCGIVINATTFYGNREQMSEIHYDFWMFGYTTDHFDTYLDEQGNQYKEYIKSALGLPSDLHQQIEYRRLRVTFNDPVLNTGHRIWDGYRLHDIQIFPTSTINRRYVDMYWYSSGINLYWNGGSVSVPDIEAGEYILYRSNLLPVEIQGRFQEVSGLVQPCGIAIRNGNNILLEGICEGTNITASIGDATTRLLWDDMDTWSKSMYLNSGLLLRIYSYSGTPSSLYAEGLGSVFENAEGVLTLTEGGFRQRSGIISSSVSGFVSSWKIPMEESLWNPANHKMYTYTKDYYLCQCPNSTENFDNRQSTIGNLTYLSYNGVLNCTFDYPCEETINGAEEWPSSLLPSYVIEAVNIFVQVEDSTGTPVLVLRCNFTTADGFYYKIQWKVDGNLALESDFLGHSEVANYSISDEEILTEVPDMYLNSEIQCSAGVYSSKTDSAPLLPYTNSSVFIPLLIQSDRVYLTRGGKTAISLKRNIPVACIGGSGCLVNIKVYDTGDDPDDCTDSIVGVISQTMCGYTLYGITSPVSSFETEDIDITITTTNDKMYTSRTSHRLELDLQIAGETTGLWSRAFNTSIWAYVTDTTYWQKRRCYVNNDPRMGTFDRIYYYHQPIGEFILYEHTVLPVQIQVKTMSCNRGWATCSCAVTVRAGSEVFTVNHCSGYHVETFLTEENERILVEEKISSYRKKITLPHGTVVDIRVSPWRWYMVNVNIYPSPADVGNVRGLCGNFNGDNTDDFKHRDGTVETTNVGWYYYAANDFIESWRVDFSESLLNPEFYQSLGSWAVQGESICVCQQIVGISVLQCSANEKYLCLSFSPNSSGRRKKRSKNSELALQQVLTDLHAKSEVQHVVKRSTDETMSLEEAIADCATALNKTCTAKAFSSVLPDEEQLIEDCARDLQINDEVEWGGETCSTMQTAIEDQVNKDQNFTEENTGYLVAFNAVNCQGNSNCSGHGECVNGTCICDPGYGLEDCYLKKSDPPRIFSVEGNGVCDVSTGDTCNCIEITTNGTSDDAVCVIGVFVLEYDHTVQENTVTTVITNVTLLSFNEVICCIPENTRRKRSTQTNSIAQKYSISLSNDGQNFGESSSVYILDTTCQETGNNTNGTTVVVLKSGYCYIEGVCIENNTRHNSESCLVCRPDTAPFDWTQDGCVTTTTATNLNASDDDSDNTMTIVIIAVSVACVVAIAIAVVAVVAYSKKKNRLHPDLHIFMVSEPGPDQPKNAGVDGPKNSRFKSLPMAHWLTTQNEKW